MRRRGLVVCGNRMVNSHAFWIRQPQEVSVRQVLDRARGIVAQPVDTLADLLLGEIHRDPSCGLEDYMTRQTSGQQERC